MSDSSEHQPGGSPVRTTAGVLTKGKGKVVISLLDDDDDDEPGLKASERVKSEPQRQQEKRPDEAIATEGGASSSSRSGAKPSPSTDYKQPDTAFFGGQTITLAQEEIPQRTSSARSGLGGPTDMAVAPPFEETLKKAGLAPRALSHLLHHD